MPAHTTRIGMVLSLFSATVLAMGQAPSILWQRCLGGVQAEEGSWLQELGDGTMLLTGTTNSTAGDFPSSNGGKDIWVAGLSASGALLWQHVFGGSGDDEARSVLQAADGSMVVAGSTTSNNGDVSGAHGDRDAWVAKLNTTGQVLWQRALGGSGRDQAYALTEAPDGGFVLCGMTTVSDGDVSGSHGLWDAWVMKLNADGQLQWQRCFGGTDNDWANGLAIAADGSIYIAASTYSSDGDATGYNGGGDAWVLKLDMDGALQWQLPVGTSYLQEGGSICVAASGDLFLAGHTNSDFEEPAAYVGNARYMAARISPDGDLLWKHWYHGYHYDRPTSILPVEDDLLLFGSSFNYLGSFDFVHQGYDPFALRITADGDSIWSRIWGGTSMYDYGQRMIPTADGDYLFIGSVWSDNGDVEGWLGGGDAWVVKLALADLGMDDQLASAQLVAPNPNQGAFDLYLKASVANGRASLFDARGRVVHELFQLKAGPNHIALPGLAPGIYQLRSILADAPMSITVIVQ